MRSTYTILGVFVLFFLEESCAQCFPAFGPNQPNKNAHSDLYAGQQEFSLGLLNAINKVMPNENLFFSPYSTYHALLTAYFLAGGQTATYLKKTLRLGDNQDKPDIYTAYKTDKLMTQILAKGAPYEFTSANKIYVSDTVPVRECVLNDFPDELQIFSFKTNPEEARQTINNWVENTTHHMIKNLLPPGSIDSQTDLVLVNAAYFKGVWENKFDPTLTKQEVFYVNPKKQIMVDMMHVEGSFKHDVSETLGSHILEMPYKGDNISMYILLPPFSNTEDSIDATLKSLTLDNFKKIVSGESLISRTVQVALPKFSLETTVELVPVLERLGVGDLFRSTSDLTALTEPSDTKQVHLGSCLHRAKIEVNEEGTKAAAATVAFSFRSSRPLEPTQFFCNHPFIYFIYDKIQQAVLFGGLFRRPY